MRSASVRGLPMASPFFPFYVHPIRIFIVDKTLATVRQYEERFSDAWIGRFSPRIFPLFFGWIMLRPGRFPQGRLSLDCRCWWSIQSQ